MGFARRATLFFLCVFGLLGLVLGSGCSPKPKSPEIRDPGLVEAAGAITSPVLLVGAERKVYARVRITTRALPPQQRGPVNVALAIDTSGSMEGKPIEEARRAALFVLDSLRDGDRLAVVAFHTKTEVLLPSTELDEASRAEVRRSIEAIQAQGTTDLANGLNTAIAEVQNHFNAQGLNRVMLIGDGVPNEPGSIEYSARAAGQQGIAITVVGLGLDYDEVLMGKIADLSGGRFRYIEDAEKMAGFFKEEMDRLNLVIGRNAYATLTAGPGVRIEAVVGATDSPSGNRATVQLGEITAGYSRDIVVRLGVTPRKAGAPIELLDTVITFTDGVVEGGQLERRVYFGAYASDDEAKVAKARNKDVELSAALAEAASTTIQALALAKQGYYVRAREMLTKGAEQARSQAEVTPSADLKKQADDMVAVASDMPKEDRAKPAQPASAYEFQDDQMNVEANPAPAEQLTPAAASTRKSVHESSYQYTH